MSDDRPATTVTVPASAAAAKGHRWIMGKFVPRCVGPELLSEPSIGNYAKFFIIE